MKCDVRTRSWSFRVLRPRVDTVRCEQNLSLRSPFKATYNSNCIHFHFESTFLSREDIFWVKVLDAHRPISGSAFELVWARNGSKPAVCRLAKAAYRRM